jgi:tryptophanyl-tRNA synthetase
MNKPTVVGGIRPTNKLHIGNYLGALKQFVEISRDESKESYFFIVDLHALTTPFEPKEVRQNTLDAAASYLAAGFEVNNSCLFIQSHLPEHAELAWIFNCITPLGELERMTQFKEKSQAHTANINAGLLDYPVLMAADILLYKPTGISVGDDQVQHVELARTIARKFNHKFGKTFPEPQTFVRKPLRIMSLTDPTKKMSKTGDPGTSNGSGRSEALFMDDSPAEIARKLKKAVTASESGKKSAGEENLMLLLSHFGQADDVRHFTEAQNTGKLKYSELKDTLAKDISKYFTEFREKKKELLAKPYYLAEVLGNGASQARKVASETLLEVKQKIGLL